MLHVIGLIVYLVLGGMGVLIWLAGAVLLADGQAGAAAAATGTGLSYVLLGRTVSGIATREQALSNSLGHRPGEGASTVPPPVSPSSACLRILKPSQSSRARER